MSDVATRALQQNSASTGGAAKDAGRTAGVAPSQLIRAMVKDGRIAPAADAEGISPRQVQPASLDLRLGPRAYRVRASFLPGANATVEQRLRDFAMHEIDLTRGAALETGCVYVVPLQERLALPEIMSAAANAKSSTGRLDVFTRLITDYGVEFDRVDAGYSGPLYAEISPRTFSVLARTGDRLNQIRFRQGVAQFDAAEMATLQARYGLITAYEDDDAPLQEADLAEGIGFSVDLKPRDQGPVGYRARPHSGLIDLSRIGHYDPSDFWDPLYPSSLGPSGAKGVILDPGAFYILVSRERVQVPAICAAEMTPYLPVVGEFRVHYAGFFDPGFGCAETGGDGVAGQGSRGVLEVRCHEAPFALEHGQVVGRLVYEPMLEPPDMLYGGDIGSNYQAQGLKLSKHFKPPTASQ